MRKYILLLCAMTIAVASNAQLKGLMKKAEKAKNELLGNKAGSLDVSGGLKEALEKGVESAVQSLSSENGYLESAYKVILPAEATTVIKKLKAVPGFQDVETKLISKMNAAAELAAKKATPIFIDAITSMSFSDATNILMGDQDAATRYLETTTRKSLYDSFLPVIHESLEEVGAISYWSSATTAYNKLPFVKKVNPALDDHVNKKALDGLFGLIEVKELDIRTDIGVRDTPLLKEVFAKQDK